MYKSGTFVASEELENVTGEEIVVFPNLFQNQLTIDFVSKHDLYQMLDVNIYDLSGKVLINTQVDLSMGSNQIPMDVSTLQKER